MTDFKIVVPDASKNPSRPETSGFEPAYVKLLESGELGRRVEKAMHGLKDCDLCGRYCHVDRQESIRGAVCRTGEQAVVHSFGPHHGEEKCLRGRRGSGTVFFSWCNLRCVYCLNWEIAWEGRGEPATHEGLADMMLDLQDMGCHNVNLVTPSHVVAQILAAVEIAARRGLRLPLVFNTGGYDSLEALTLLDGVVDVYLPDMKYGDSELARKYSRVRRYVEHNQRSVREMYRQVGDLVIDEDGIARRGLLVRQLVLPNGIAGTASVLQFLAEEISPKTHLNLMDQYSPCFRADEHPELNRGITSSEYEEALEHACRFGFHRLES